MLNWPTLDWISKIFQLTRNLWGLPEMVLGAWKGRFDKAYLKMVIENNKIVCTLLGLRLSNIKPVLSVENNIIR